MLVPGNLLDSPASASSTQPPAAPILAGVSAEQLGLRDLLRFAGLGHRLAAFQQQGATVEILAALG